MMLGTIEFWLGDQCDWCKTLGEPVNAIASSVQSSQVAIAGDYYESWPGEEVFMGAIVNGMVSAFSMTADTAYSGTAWQGAASMHAFQEFGQWQDNNSFGDQVFAFARLEQLQTEDARFNIWGFVLDHFYDDVQAIGDPFNTDILYGNKQYLINGLWQGETSSNVYYLANHTVAAFMADAEDRVIWREGLIRALALVSDDARFPVMALGAATWALTTTGPLDDTPMDTDAEEGSQWHGGGPCRPASYFGHQIPEGGVDEGSFFWRFDHGDAGGSESVLISVHDPLLRDLERNFMAIKEVFTGIATTKGAFPNGEEMLVCLKSERHVNFLQQLNIMKVNYVS